MWVKSLRLSNVFRMDAKIIDWAEISFSLNKQGYALIQNAIAASECGRLIPEYCNTNLYRSTINMERYRFGKGEYKYFKYPLPAIIQNLREKLYAELVPVANLWNRALGLDIHYPETHGQFIEECHSKNQIRPTPLILRYEAGGYNTLHQDLYGDVYFPFQVVFLLNQHGVDYEGGDFVMVEQVPRAQSKAEVIRPNLGDAVIFTTNFRPVKGSKGYYRARLKHGVSEVKSGRRYAMGVIFHDAT